MTDPTQIPRSRAVSAQVFVQLEDGSTENYILMPDPLNPDDRIDATLSMERDQPQDLIFDKFGPYPPGRRRITIELVGARYYGRHYPATTTATQTIGEEGER